MSTPAQKFTIGKTSYTITIDAGANSEIPILFTYNVDGTGTAKDVNYDGEEITFTWDPATLEDLKAEEIEETLSGHSYDLSGMRSTSSLAKTVSFKTTITGAAMSRSRVAARRNSRKSFVS